jgi:hypothetical protein
MERPEMPQAVQRVTLLATLGGQPQVVTFALDLLLARGIPIRDVLVVHLADPSPRLRRARERLAAEFVGDRYAGYPCRQQVQERLHITLGTVNDHKTDILGYCRNAWELPEGTSLDYHFLREKFGRFFNETGPPL